MPAAAVASSFADRSSSGIVNFNCPVGAQMAGKTASRSSERRSLINEHEARVLRHLKPSRTRLSALCLLWGLQERGEQERN